MLKNTNTITTTPIIYLHPIIGGRAKSVEPHAKRSQQELTLDRFFRAAVEEWSQVGALEPEKGRQVGRGLEKGR